MKRKELLDMLAMVRPALSTNNSLSAVFSHYCFDGNNLITYDGARLGIVVPFKTKFKGGVSGRVLDALLSTGTEDVSFAMVPGGDAGNLEIKSGNSVMTLAAINVDDLAVVFQKEFLDGVSQSVKVDGKALLGAVSCCMNSIGGDTSKIEQTGLYFRRDRDYLVIYGFNNISLSVAEVKLTDGAQNELGLPDDGLLLPGVFCKLMVDYLKDDDQALLGVGGHYASMASGKLNAYGTLIQQQTKVDFEKLLNDNFPLEDSKKPVAIPPGLKDVLERACVIINTKVDGQLRTEVNIRDGLATFLSRSQRGEVDDVIDMPGHPDIKLAIDPRPVLDALPFFATEENSGKLLFTEKCAVFARVAQTYMVAAFQPKKD